jgi:hypothetical protein
MPMPSMLSPRKTHEVMEAAVVGEDGNFGVGSAGSSLDWLAVLEPFHGGSGKAKGGNLHFHGRALVDALVVEAGPNPWLLLHRAAKVFDRPFGRCPVADHFELCSRAGRAILQKNG